jgi:hypothetical protein
MALVGPGSQQPVTEDVHPLLEGASEYEYVTILNPLSDDFAVRVAQDVPVNLPLQIRKGTGLIQNGGDVVRNYGLDLKNPEFKARKSIFSDVIIKSGRTKTFKGSEAQVAVRQLVNEILQRRGQKRLMADPTLRRQVEEEIVQERGNMQSLMDEKPRTPSAQIDAALTKLNEAEDEQPFPTITNRPTSGDAEEGGDGDGASVQQERRSPGRPKKT